MEIRINENTNKTVLRSAVLWLVFYTLILLGCILLEFVVQPEELSHYPHILGIPGLSRTFASY